MHHCVQGSDVVLWLVGVDRGDDGGRQGYAPGKEYEPAPGRDLVFRLKE